MKIVLSIVFALTFGACSGTQSSIQMCPDLTFQAKLPSFLAVNAAFPTDDTASDTPQNPASDCVFHQWAAEAFVWATALGSNGLPRFIGLHAISELSGAAPQTTLTMYAFVQADGNLQVGPNGYPVYTTVHMNDSYFNTALKNMTSNGGYKSQPADSYFDLGAAVFKATWMRLDPGQQAPVGAFTTIARVPVLASSVAKGQTTVNPIAGSFTLATVALVGLHVVGYTQNHPEFLWATFEHKLNSPRSPDGTFSLSGSSSTSYTFYVANTSYQLANKAFPASLSFNSTTQKFSPSTVTVLENATGAETFSARGPKNIDSVNQSLASTLVALNSSQSLFGNYDLIGTLWLQSGFYNSGTPAALNFGVNASLGSVNLANSTAETFEQPITNPVQGSKFQNCFMCHSSTSYTFPTDPSLPARRIAISHAIATGDSNFDIPNTITFPQAPPAPQNSLVGVRQPSERRNGAGH